MPKTKQCNFCHSSTFIFDKKHYDNNYYIDKTIYELYRCDQCGLVFIDQPPSGKEIGKYYPKTYYAYKTGKNVFFVLKNWWILSLKKLPKRLSQYFLFDQLYFYPSSNTASVLDVGCGDGSALSMLSSLGFETLEGTEIDKDNCKQIHDRYGYKVHNISTINSLKSTERYSAIRMNHVLEHVYDPLETIEKAHSLLEDNGVFYIAVPNYNSVASKLFGNYYCGLQLPTHMFHFNKTTLINQLQVSGFKVTKCKTVGLSGIAFSFITLLRDKYNIRTPGFISLALTILFIPAELLLNLTGNGFMMNFKAIKITK